MYWYIDVWGGHKMTFKETCTQNQWIRVLKCRDYSLEWLNCLTKILWCKFTQWVPARGPCDSFLMPLVFQCFRLVNRNLQKIVRRMLFSVIDFMCHCYLLGHFVCQICLGWAPAKMVLCSDTGNQSTQYPLVPALYSGLGTVPEFWCGYLKNSMFT